MNISLDILDLTNKWLKSKNGKKKKDRYYLETYGIRKSICRKKLNLILEFFTNSLLKFMNFIFLTACLTF